MPGPAPLSRTTSVFTSKIVTLHDSSDRLVLRQRPGRWFRWGTWAWGVITLIMIAAFVSEWFGGGWTTRFTCSRASGHCERDGIRGTLPPLAEIERAELRRYHVTKQGDFHAITLHTRAGQTFDVDSYGAQRDDAIASYRATVDDINRFLADPAQQQLDTSFTYHASGSEKARAMVLLVSGLLLLALALALYRAARFTFERARVTLVTRGPFVRDRRELAGDQIRAVVDRRDASGCALGLDLTDGSTVIVLQSSSPDPLAQKISAVLGKPLEQRGV